MREYTGYTCSLCGSIEFDVENVGGREMYHCIHCHNISFEEIEETDRVTPTTEELLEMGYTEQELEDALDPV